MDIPPPAYSQPIDRRKDRLPPYRAKHGFANSQEELAALKEFANSKLYVSRGSGGTLPDLRDGGWGLKGLAWGGPISHSQSGEGSAMGERGWPAPETEEERRARKEREKIEKREERARKGSIGERLKRVMLSGSAKDARAAGGSGKEKRIGNLS